MEALGATTSSAGCNDVVQTLKSWIERGKMRPGMQLPAERELSTELNVKRPTVRNALKILEGEGWLEQTGPRTRIIAERMRLMDHSIVIINTARHQWYTDRMRMPGWAVISSVGALAEVSDSGYNLVLIHPEQISPRELRRVLLGRPTGVVIPERVGDFADKLSWLKELHKAGIPVVIYGDGPELAAYDRVYSDHESGCYKLTRYLLSIGRKRPLMFYSLPIGTSIPWVQARREGYERAMHEAGLEPLPTAYIGAGLIGRDQSCTPEGFDAARRHALSYLIDHVGSVVSQKTAADSLLLASDGDLCPVSAACRTLGVIPGEDVLLAGYDNYWAECCERNFEKVVPTATVDKLNGQSGRLLVRLMLERANGQLPAEPQVRAMEPELVICGKNKDENVSSQA